MTHLPNGAPIAAIPEALRQRDQWVLWRLDPKDDKPDELTKVPYTNVKYRAKANKSTTWIAFDEAVRRWEANPNGWAGIGYEFGLDTGGPYITGIDFDNCLDPATGSVEQWADRELAELLPTYAEISWSDKGIKLWVETERAHTLGSDDKDAGQVEVYSSGRFFAVSGRAFEDAPATIAKVDDAIVEQIIAREQERRQARRPKAATNGTRPPSTNGTYPPLALAGLVGVLNQLHDDRWAAYDDWLRIGMALHHWAGGDDQRSATARALFDQYSKERAPEVYGEVGEKWESFGKRNGDARLVTVGTLIEWAKEDNAEEPPHPADATDDPRPAIDITALDLPTIMPQAWNAVAAWNEPPTLFHRAGELARLEKTESGALLVRTVDTRRMAGILARAARWVRVSYARGGTPIEKETLPPGAVIDDCMVNIDTRIPPITRVVYAPTFAEGNILLTTPGYHAAARIYYDPKPGATVPTVPESPTVADLARARSLVLNELLVDFPFVSDADQAHAVALFLLPFVRDLINGPTPLHLIEAPTMGSGKGLLADVALLPALGDTPTPMAEAATDEEWGKKITSNLLAAPAVIYIDNLNRMLAAGALAAALTAREFSDRILGKSENVSLPVRCVWVATANNPTLSTEISRRCIRIRIDPRVDQPWKREGFKHPKLRTWVEERRGDLIWAALVICRYGLQHGAAGPALGSYEAWSDVLGRILQGAGFSGFLGNLDALYDRADVEGAAWRALIAAWWEKHQDTALPTGELFPLVAEADVELLVNGRDEIGRKKSFGKAMARALDRVFSVEIDGVPTRLQVADGGTRHKTRLWKLAPVEKGGIGGLGAFSLPHARRNDFASSQVKKNTQNTQNPHAVEEVSLPL